MKRPIWNIVVDTVSLVTFMFMISTGLILKFILPPGSGRVEMLLTTRDRGHQTIDLFMGLSRHDWGSIHLYISLGFLILLIIHLYLHWSWIVAMVWGTKVVPQPLHRRVIKIGIVIFIILALAFPWIGQALGQKKTHSSNDYLQAYQQIP